MNRAQMFDAYVAATAEKVTRKYLVSDSVKDCRLKGTETIIHRCETRIGLTTGYASGAEVSNEYLTAARTPRKRPCDELKPSRRARKAIAARNDAERRALVGRIAR